MIQTVIRLALVAVFAFGALAADINGKWKASFQTPNGQTRENTFDFKVDGETLTGTISSAMGEAKIQEGKVSGDDVSFSVLRNFGGNEVKVNYKGKVSGNEMKLKVEFGGGDRTFEMTAKKI